MARIPLRAYHHEIEALIDQGQYDQVIAHCRHILNFFPKNIDTYRLLGKGYLESQHYSDAADIFQRVLTSLPDDFIAHLGMSIIGEDNGSLEDAIWHMERAFEVQPSNTTIQGELRRLYGKRDGFEPAKIRLTRGALARMYVKGDLYLQAIAELRAALNEDQQRPDLQVLLARAYFLAGQKVEAAQVCTTLLSKLPFCLEANRILAEILSASERAAEADAYRQRVQDLDPYAAQVSANSPTPDSVPDSAVSVEKLEIQPGTEMNGFVDQPSWVPSQENEISTPESTSETPTTLPEGMLAPKAASELPDLLGQAPASEVSAEPSAGDQIPEWMKEAGWAQTDGDSEKPEDFAGFETETTGGEEIAPAEIPEWLRPLAPEPSPELPEEVPPEGAGAELAWLAKETRPEENPPAPEGESPDWLQDIQPAAIVEPEPEEAPALPEWLAGAESESQDADELPDWLKELEEQSGASDQQAQPQTPEAGPRAEPEEGEAAEGDIPTWLLALGADQKIAPAEPAAQEAMDEDDEAFAWLENLAARQGASSYSEPAAEDHPDTQEGEGWVHPDELQAAAATSVSTTGDGLAAGAPAEPTEPEGSEPEWLREFELQPPVEPTAETPAETPVELAAEAPTEIPSGETTPETTVETDEENLAEASKETPSPGGAEIFDLTEESAAGPGTEDIPDWLRGPALMAAAGSILDKGTISEEDTKPTRVAKMNEIPVPEPAEPWTRGQTEEEPAGEGASKELMVSEAENSSTIVATEATAEEQAVPEEPAQDEQVPDWLRGLAVLGMSQQEETIESPLETEAGSAEMAPAGEWTSEAGEITEPPAEWTLDAGAAAGLAAGAAVFRAEPPAKATPEAGEETEQQAVEAEISPGMEAEPAAPTMHVAEAAAGLAAAEVVFPGEPPTEQAPAEDETGQPAEETGVLAEIADEAAPAVEMETGQTTEKERAEPELEMEAEPPSQAAAISGSIASPEAEQASGTEPLPPLPEWLSGLEQPEAAVEEKSDWMMPVGEEPVAPVESETQANRVSLNEAPLIELERVPGIGYIRAQAIISYRESNGPFEQLEDLAAVPGFDEEAIAAIRDQVSVEQLALAAPVQEPVNQHQIQLIKARNALAEGNREEALQQYLPLIQSRVYLTDVINDLHEALYRFPVDVSIWEALGDAFARNDQLQEALDAYTKAEELLR